MTTKPLKPFLHYMVFLICILAYNCCDYVFIFACLPFSNDIQYNYLGFCGCAVFIRPTDVKCVVLTKAAKPIEQ